MEELAAVRRLKLEQCVSLTTYQSDASQVSLLSLFFPFFIRFFPFFTSWFNDDTFFHFINSAYLFVFPSNHLFIYIFQSFYRRNLFDNSYIHLKKFIFSLFIYLFIAFLFITSSRLNKHFLGYHVEDGISLHERHVLL